MTTRKNDPAADAPPAKETEAKKTGKSLKATAPEKVEKAKKTESVEKPAGVKPEKAPAKAAPKPKSKSRSKAKPAKDQQIVFDPTADRSLVADQAIENPVILTTLIENLSTATRRIRQFSAAAIGTVSESAPEILVVHIPHIVDALHRPEAQTRWESLDILTRIVAYNPDACDDAVIGAEGSLYDEESGSARLAAVRFLCAYGTLDAKRSARVWPLLDEAIQCYHGDPEFQDMLISVISFAGGSISKEVRTSLASRMDFDATYGKGPLKRRAAQIVELCKKG
jgi:hypothetical protein